MRKDKYAEAKKEWFTLQKRYEANRKAQRALGWIELPKPRFAGYEKFYVLRDDIARREDSWVFQQIIDKFGKTVKSKTKDFTYYDWTLRKKLVARPGIRAITIREFEALHPQVKKHFYKSEAKEDWDFRSREYMYRCSIDQYYFSEKIRKYYITRVREHNEILAQEESEIRWMMEKNPLFSKLDSRNWWYGNHYTTPKWYRRMLNRKEKFAAKKEIRRIVKLDDCDGFRYTPNHRDAAWRYY